MAGWWRGGSQGPPTSSSPSLRLVAEAGLQVRVWHWGRWAALGHLRAQGDGVLLPA